ncbi:MAG: ABC transporter substrate-binding protein, partial [Candidatus Bipolaricaulota bacterium]
SQNVDIVITIATNTSVAAKQVLDETPILVTAVTNFEIAGLVDSMEAYENPGDNENITGYSDQIPVKSQFELIREMVPNVEKVGNIYNAGEPNSSFLTELAEDACDEMGIELIKATVSNTSEVSQAAQSLRGRVDAIWISTDNTVVSGLGPVAQVAKKEKIPVVVADPTSVGKGALVGYGFDYYDHGRLAGQKLIQLLEGEKPNEIPIGIGAPEDQKLVLDLDQAEEMGFEFPSSVVEKANAIRYLGEMWKKQ